ncbi:MAG: SIMPL domain-containing protein [Leptolyngbyaceae cyanobacterium RU_5_1]|nr:SIMPL domain-containing protein [Leptolyngbyaceae cyanobacterium RU_5_1]
MISLWIGQTQPTIAQVRTEQFCKRPSATAADGSIPECVLLAGRRSLTVIGQGQVTAPADTAMLEFAIGDRGSSGSEADSPGVSLQTTKRITENALSPTVNALIAAGVPASNITIQTSPLQNPKLLVQLDKPTQDKVQQVVLTVDQSLASNKQIFLQSISAGYAVNTCEPLQRSARRIALQDAQSQLTTLAQDLKIQPGELLSVTMMPFTASRTAISCGSKVAVPVSPLSLTSEESTPPYNPSDKPEVQVRSQVSVTHAIKAGDRSSPKK